MVPIHIKKACNSKVLRYLTILLGFERGSDASRVSHPLLVLDSKGTHCSKHLVSQKRWFLNELKRMDTLSERRHIQYDLLTSIC